MSADNDGDSQMLSSPSDSEVSNPTTAPNNTSNSDPATLSPPSSGTRSSARLVQPPPTSSPSTTSSSSETITTMPTALPTSNGANANGKRPLNALSNGDTTAPAAQTNLPPTSSESASAPKQQHAPRSHQGRTPQGNGFTYVWTKAEDEPGWAWMNKKAVDEIARAGEGVAHKEYGVGARYGDPFEMAESEQAEMESLKT